MMNEKFINSICEAILASDGKWESGMKVPFPQNYFTKKRYRGGNLLLLWFTAIKEGYTSPYWTGFHQCSNAGGKVIAGSKGTWIQFWGDRIMLVSPDGEWKSPKQLGLSNDLQPGTYIDGWKVVARKAATSHCIFNFCQVEGLPKIEPEPLIFTSLEDMILSYLENSGTGIDFGISETPFYSVEADLIKISRDYFVDSEHYLSALCHETIHSTGHPSRLARFKDSQRNDMPKYSVEELTAELGSMLMLSNYGFNNFNNNISYLANWVRNTELEQRDSIIMAISRAEIAIDYITNYGRKKNDNTQGI